MFELFNYEFMQRAFAAGLLVAVICPLIGTFVVMRRLSMIGDTLSHASLAGIAAGMLGGLYPLWGALIFSLSAAIGIEKLRKSFPQYAELSISIVLSASIGLAVVLISLANSFNADLMSYLFGSIIAVNALDIYIILGLSIIILVSVGLFYKEFFYMAFDEEGAELAGMPVSSLNMYFTVLTAMTIVVSMRVVGMMMVSSLMVVPVACSLLISKSFKNTIVLSVLFALISVIIGLFSSYWFDLAPGGSIVLTSVFILIAIIIVKRIFRMQ
ncbi:MAG TPA: metal ABC transporter permease [Bacillota bacterium]|jgi:zinc transport system permease protein|nr:metal ABC transporter permease [Bacillota bacterium]HQI15901.1 metal ABC transporter permease [Bacillota bacterium]HQJ36722.1 metal ABC transporter permease [Bacillota bacterium]HQL37826.1 metal ABC transporter permease [Bacillota bacterium]HRS21226.1 metal ABC transporter permease [Clostridia bacterium]